MEKELKSYCELYWWNMGKKTLEFKGELKDLLDRYEITYTQKPTNDKNIYLFSFKTGFGLTFTKKAPINGFSELAKKFINISARKPIGQLCCRWEEFPLRN